MADPARARRLSKRIQEIVASAIEREIKDRRLEFVTITDCRVTGDLHDATVFYTVRGRTLDEEPDYESAAAALEKAKGQLRSLVGRGTGVRYTPTLALRLTRCQKSPRTLRSCSIRLARATRNWLSRPETLSPQAMPTHTATRSKTLHRPHLSMKGAST